ncbi:MAG: FKBP-type peptidyl-prolyl cis-trans isomerase [Prevotella sp.]|nr:FKBP-type peptidyl-prolyl cis-trans isomerase [Prevotella sp.]
MEKNTHKYITLAYKLYTIEDGKKGLVEQTSADRPFEFITGFGITIDDFEQQVAGLQPGEAFDFTLPVEKAYGPYIEEKVLHLDRDIFTINGHFDHENIFKGAAVPLQNEEGDRFMGQVLDITDDKVVMDLNHPLAGKDLNFVGNIIDTREATDEEIVAMINRGDCGCGCDDCEDGCGDHEGHDHHGCGCGHCH